MVFPVLIGVGALALLIAASRTDTVQRIASHVARTIVPVTHRSVYRGVNSKSGKKIYRIEVVESPQSLADLASKRMGRKIPLDTLALAFLMASETGNGHPLAKIAVAHAALTAARREGKSVFAKLAYNGHFGSQLGNKPFASTRLAPTRADVELAEAVQAGKYDNPAPGADQWDSPRGQGKLLAIGTPEYSASADDVARSRIAAGKEAVYLPGIDPNYLRLWRPAA